MKRRIEEMVEQAAIESLPVGLMIIEKTGSIRVVNQAMAEILGYSQDFFIGRGWGQIFFTEDGRNLEFNQVIIDVILKETQNMRRTVPYETPEGEKRHLAMVSSFLRDEKSEDYDVGIVVIVQDITDIQRLHEREKEIMARNAALHQQRERGLKSLALSVAHQIRNPVMTIGGYANMLARKSEDGTKERQWASSIFEESKRLEQVVKEVADFASMPPAKKKPSSLCPVVEQAHALAEERAEEAGKPLEVDKDCADAPVNHDPQLMGLALSEVFANSVDFSDKDAVKIRITGKVVEKDYRLEITDNGPGFDAESLDYVFDPFFTTKPVGVGMGLTKAYRCLSEHEGSVVAENRASGGARVVILLPLGQDQEEPARI